MGPRWGHLSRAANVRTRVGKWLFEVLVRCTPRLERVVDGRTRGDHVQDDWAVVGLVEGLSMRLSRPTEVTNEVTAMH